MNNDKLSLCTELEESPAKSGFYPLEKLLPKQCCSVKILIHALKPVKYSIQAEFNYDQGKVEAILVETEVEPSIEAELPIGVVILAYTLTRLSLNFTLRVPD